MEMFTCALETEVEGYKKQLHRSGDAFEYLSTGLDRAEGQLKAALQNKMMKLISSVRTNIDLLQTNP